MTTLEVIRGAVPLPLLNWDLLFRLERGRRKWPSLSRLEELHISQCLAGCKPEFLGQLRLVLVVLDHPARWLIPVNADPSQLELNFA